MTNMEQIERDTRLYADAKRELNRIMAEVMTETEALKKKYTGQIRRALARVTERHEDLYREIAENKDLFVKPRTQTFDGINVGLKKGKGRLEIADEDKAIAIIEDDFPKLAKLLVKTEKSLLKDLVKKQDPEFLAAIGGAIVGQEDYVVIEDVDTQIEKVLTALLKFQTSELKTEYCEEAA